MGEREGWPKPTWVFATSLNKIFSVIQPRQDVKGTLTRLSAGGDFTEFCRHKNLEGIY
jgi:hypothetical protein